MRRIPRRGLRGSRRTSRGAAIAKSPPSAHSLFGREFQWQYARPSCRAVPIPNPIDAHSSRSRKLFKCPRWKETFIYASLLPQSHRAVSFFCRVNKKIRGRRRMCVCMRVEREGAFREIWKEEFTLQGAYICTFKVFVCPCILSKNTRDFYHA